MSEDSKKKSQHIRHLETWENNFDSGFLDYEDNP